MENLTGRHRRPHQSMAGRMWALAAAVLAAALAYMFVPAHPGRERAAIAAPPRRRELPPASFERHSGQRPPDFPDDDLPDPDQVGGALVRPYLSPQISEQLGPVVPAPRVRGGDLLAEPAQDDTDDLSDLAAVVRLYLEKVG